MLEGGLAATLYRGGVRICLPRELGKVLLLSFLELSASSKMSWGNGLISANISSWADGARSFVGILSCDWRHSIKEKLVWLNQSQNQKKPSLVPREDQG